MGMAKDRRKKKTEHVIVTEGKTKPVGKKKNKGKTVLLVLLIVLLLASVLFVVLIGKYALDQIRSSENDTPSVDLTQFQTTPDENKDKVGYYVIGVLGDEGEPMAALSLLCHDKLSGTVNILQLPQETYLGETADWAVTKVGEVWANPKPLDWCETCGQRLYPAAIADGRHAACGTPTSTKTGSSVVNLMSVFNDQYAMPVDGYFLFSKESLIKLIDLLDGLDVDLEKAMTVGEIEYKKGVQTLDGASALHYLSMRDKEEKGELDRLVRQRKVLSALLQRLTAKTDEVLLDDLLDPLMKGSTPIRTNISTKNMVAMLAAFRWIPLDKMTAYIMPGEWAAANSTTYFSIHRAELAALLAASFNPYGRTISEADLLVTEIALNKQSDMRAATLAETAVPQQGASVTTGTTGTTAQQ